MRSVVECQKDPGVIPELIDIPGVSTCTSVARLAKTEPRIRVRATEISLNLENAAPPCKALARHLLFHSPSATKRK